MDSIAVSAYYSGARASSAVIRLHLDRATIPNSRKHRTFVCVCVVHCSIVHGEERRVYTNQSCWARQTVSILYTKCRRKITRRYTLTAFTYPKRLLCDFNRQQCGRGRRSLHDVTICTPRYTWRKNTTF